MASDDPIEWTAEFWERRGYPGFGFLEAATSVMLAQQYVAARLTDALRPLGLTWSRFEALTILEQSPDGMMPLARTSERLLMHPSSVTSTIDRLEEQGLVERTPHPSDRRVTVARITPAGSELAERAIMAVLDVDYGLPQGTTEDELRRIIEVMAPLRKAAVEYQVQRRSGRPELPT
jgi:DNA-binding MarR family transcriptional regulator